MALNALKISHFLRNVVDKSFFPRSAKLLQFSQNRQYSPTTKPPRAENPLKMEEGMCSKKC